MHLTNNSRTGQNCIQVMERHHCEYSLCHGNSCLFHFCTVFSYSCSTRICHKWLCTAPNARTIAYKPVAHLFYLSWFRWVKKSICFEYALLWETATRAVQGVIRVLYMLWKCFHGSGKELFENNDVNLPELDILWNWTALTVIVTS